MDDDFVIIDEEEELKFDKDIQGFMYYDLFKKLGEKKSKKMIHYLFAKVISYGDDFENKERKEHMKKLKELKPQYKKAFGKEFI